MKNYINQLSSKNFIGKSFKVRNSFSHNEFDVTVIAFDKKDDVVRMIFSDLNPHSAHFSTAENYESLRLGYKYNQVHQQHFIEKASRNPRLTIDRFLNKDYKNYHLGFTFCLEIKNPEMILSHEPRMDFRIPNTFTNNDEYLEVINSLGFGDAKVYACNCDSLDKIHSTNVQKFVRSITSKTVKDPAFAQNINEYYANNIKTTNYQK